MFNSSRPKKRRGRQQRRNLLIDVLEQRQLLAGDVMSTYAAGSLTITGDGAGNGVELVPGDNPGEYRVIGTDVNGAATIVTGDTFINDPITDITVDLDTGSDTFVIRGTDVANQLEVTGPVFISDPTGMNTFSVINARITGGLSVIGGIDEDNISIEGTTVIGPTMVADPGGNNTLMVINDTVLDGMLSVTNGPDADSVFVFQSEIDDDVFIDNGDGDNKVVFGTLADPVVGGTITIIQGTGNDRVILHDTDVKESVFIDDGDGHNDVTIEQSDIGVSIIGLVLDITNGDGRDTLSITDSLITDDVVVTNGAGLFGSETTISGSTIGGDFDFFGDDGVDEITVTDTAIVNDVDLELFDGQSIVSFVRVDMGDDFELDGGMHRDHLIFSETTIEGDATIDMMDGKDTLEVLAGSQLRGVSSLAGGGHADDTFIRELTPDMVDIAFMALETFEVDEFILN